MPQDRRGRDQSIRGTWTIDEVAAYLRISRGAAYAAARAGQIPICRFGRRMLVSRAALAALLGPAPSRGTCVGAEGHEELGAADGAGSPRDQV